MRKETLEKRRSVAKAIFKIATTQDDVADLKKAVIDRLALPELDEEAEFK